MRDGFYTSSIGNGQLAFGTANSGDFQKQPPVDIARFLIDFIEYDFLWYQKIIEGFYALEIFAETLDNNYDDFEACRDYCHIAADGMQDPIGRYFAQTELKRIDAIPGDGTASFWIYQARRMVDALAAPIHAHSFISHAFQLLFAEDCGKAEGLARLFARYPMWREHLFEEGFWLEKRDGGIKLHYGKYISNQTELLLLCFLILLEQDIVIRRCECCGGYFIPKTKKTTLYCDRVIRDNKTCKVLAPTLKRKLKTEGDPALQEHDRLYKLYYARMERYEGRADLNRRRTENDIAQEEFYLWSVSAQKLRRQYLAGAISAEVFLEGITLEH